MAGNDNLLRVIQREEEEESWLENDTICANQRKEDREEGNLTYRKKSKN